VAATAAMTAMISDLEAHLLREGFSPETLRAHRHIWEIIIRYAKQKGYRIIKRSWVWPLMQERYTDETGKLLRKGYQNYFRAAELLCDFTENGYVSRKWRKRQDVKCAVVEQLKADLLNEQHYSPYSVNHLNYTWMELAAHAAANKYKSYAREWVIPYMQKHYGITEDALPDGQQVRRRAAEMLCDYAATGSFPRRRKDLPDISEGYNSLFSALNQYCASHNLSKQVMRSFAYQLRKFVAFLIQQRLKTQDLTVAVVRAYLLTLVGYSKSTISFAHYMLRSVLHTAYENGDTKTDLSLACEHVRLPDDARIPLAFSSEQVQALLKSVDRITPTEKRDYAILLLAARLGIRAGDIRGLQFGHIKWNACEIRFVQSKTKQEVILPISEEIGLALMDYLQNARPQSGSNNVFIRHRAPYEAFGPSNSFYRIIQYYLKRSGIDLADKHIGIHSLRHSLASNMLMEGTALPVISEVLGHSSTDSTRQYLKIDIEQLRKCALSPRLEGLR